MQKSSLPYIIGGGAIAFLLYTAYKAKAVSNLLFFPGNVLSMGFMGANPVMTFNMSIQNTSSLPVTVNGLAGNLFSNGTLVGNVSLDGPITVPANTRVYQTFEAQFLLIGIVNNIIRAFQNNNFTQAMQLEGFANVSGLQVPISLELSVGL